MNRKQFNVEKSKAAILYILERTGGEKDFHTIFKMLYAADKKHLAKYGRLIIGDTYMAMKHGSVPSIVYDAFKFLRGEGYSSQELKPFYDGFQVRDNHMVYPMEKLNIDFLSKSDINSLDEAIEEIRNLNFKQRSDNSHDLAWQNVNQDEAINVFDMAKAGGANDEMIKYIAESFENYNVEIK